LPRTTRYAASATKYQLDAGQDKLEVTLPQLEFNGVKVKQNLQLHRGSYTVDAAHQVTNGGGAPVAPRLLSLLRDDSAPTDEK
jgi:YidC/Oxa1 family membrane protein insertase